MWSIFQNSGNVLMLRFFQQWLSSRLHQLCFWVDISKVVKIQYSYNTKCSKQYDLCKWLECVRKYPNTSVISHRFLILERYQSLKFFIHNLNSSDGMQLSTFSQILDLCTLLRYFLLDLTILIFCYLILLLHSFLEAFYFLLMT